MSPTITGVRPPAFIPLCPPQLYLYSLHNYTSMSPTTTGVRPPATTTVLEGEDCCAAHSQAHAHLRERKARQHGVFFRQRAQAFEEPRQLAFHPSSPQCAAQYFR